LVIFGFKGGVFFLGILFLYFLPVYLVMSKTSLEEEEKIASSFFIGVILVPTLVYYLGFLVSFKMSIFIVLILLLITSSVFVILTQRRIIRKEV
jgi:uncharacterized membrane protein